MKRRRISGTATEAIKFYRIVDTSANNAALYYRRRCSCYTVSACFFLAEQRLMYLFSLPRALILRPSNERILAQNKRKNAL